ncbi:MAG: alpha/beta hydrolase [Gemmatimonadetes bacterium]|nr:alpha/beta hydrolase [Gemmatimonadota bacterium]
MRRHASPIVGLLTVVFCAVALPAHAQLDEHTQWALDLSRHYRIYSNIPYLTANNLQVKLDIYRPLGADGPQPTVIYFHGGGWVGGSKEGAAFRLMPYLANGFVAVNVQYRLGRVSLAPAAVEDTRCALRWVLQNAEDYDIDTSRIIVTGHSAGGHLSLTTGMLPASAGLDRQCVGLDDVSVAAIVNWYGITDVADLIDGPNTKSYAVEWLGSMPDREAIAQRVSPLTYIRRGLPPTITIHGDADGVVPYSHATRLQEALDEAGVPNKLVTIPGGGHGGFSAEQSARAYAAIMDFLAEHGILEKR